MKIKVMHLINNLNTGGAETLISDYALNIDKEKFEIMIVAVGYKNNSIIEQRLKDHGIKVIHLADSSVYSRGKGKFERSLNKIHRRIVFNKIVKREKPNIIHTHLRVNDFIIPLRTKKNGISLYYTIHSDVNVFFGKMRNKLTTWFCIKYKNMTPIALHVDMQQQVNDLFKINNTVILPNGIDLKRFKNLQVNKDKMKSSLNIKKEAFIIGHIGRFVETKNHNFLIKVFANVKKKCPNAHLILIGDGELKSGIEAKVKKLGLMDSVSLLGIREDIPELLSVMDVFVFPSIHEGFGNVVIEAQAAGIRCIISSNTPEDVVSSNLVTQLSLEAPIESWSEKIIKNSPKNKNIKKLEKHDINNIVKDLELIYIEAQKNRHRERDNRK